MTRRWKLSPGLIWGSELADLLAHMKTIPCALPAINVIGSHHVAAAVRAAKLARSPIIVQFSNAGARFFSGDLVESDAPRSAIIGAVAGAKFARDLALEHGVPLILHTDHAARPLLPWVSGLLDCQERHIEREGAPLFSSHMVDLSEEPLADNLRTSQSFLRRMSSFASLEIELGVTGGEEDGVNVGTDRSRLYTRPEDVLEAFNALEPLGRFTIAASFGNTHGVYRPGNVTLRPSILKHSQELVAAKRGMGANPVDFVFHGGSGSTREQLREALSYGVVKMNIDTDTQWAFTLPVKRYMDERHLYLQSQLGNPTGRDQPNKKFFDPRVWLHLAEQGIVDRLLAAFRDLNSFGRFEF